jgi:hypothetical protein
MKPSSLLRACVLVSLVMIALATSSCSDDFYLSEKEAAAYAYVFQTEQNANMYLAGLSQQRVTVDFDMVGNTPQVRSSNLLTVMRGMTLGVLETSRSQIPLDQLASQLEKQLGTWVSGRMKLYTGQNNERVRLTDLDSVTVTFARDPVFTYNPDRQSISFDVTLQAAVDGTIEVNAISGILDFLFSIFGSNVNGTYPLKVIINDLHLKGEASIVSPFQDAGRVQFHLYPQPGTIEVRDRNASNAPGKIKDGIRKVLKYDLAKPVNEVFDQKYDYFSLSSLRLRPAIGQTPPHLDVAYLSRPELAPPTLHMVARGTDGKLYHARRINGVWTDFRQNLVMTKTFQSDPAITSSGGGQLELAATTGGQLVYAHWQDGVWSYPAVAPANPRFKYIGRPALVATAPGQVEIVVEGTNNGLWHLRRLNGAWQTPVAIPPPTSAEGTLGARSPVLVHSGNKLLLVLVTNVSDLRAIAFDLETKVWGRMVLVPTHGTVSFDPTAVASGDGRVDLVYVETGGAPFHRPIDVLTANLAARGTATSLSLLPETAIGGSLSDSPILTASGFRQLDLIGRGLDFKLSYNHFFSTAENSRAIENRTVPGWQGWAGMNGSFFHANLPPNELMNEFAATATATGHVAVVARGRVTGVATNIGQYTFHNNFNSARFGHEPWKTVGWRSFERVSNQLFVGRPALAAVDTNFEMGWVGNGAQDGNTYDGLLAEIEQISYAYLSAPVAAVPIPIDPVVLSSGPGLVDMIVISRDTGRPLHLRRINRRVMAVNDLSLPPSVRISSPLVAVSHGAGWIDLVGTANNNSVYHWRFRNGSWSSPTQLSGVFLSSPALAYVGAEQLELFAVGADRRLYRQRFVGGRWNGWAMVSGNFPINPILFGQSAVASWGDGTVDMIVVNAQNLALMHRRIGPGVEACRPGVRICPPFPRSFNAIGGTSIETPVLTAIGPSRLNVLAMGADHAFYNKWGSPPSPPGMFVGDPPINWGDLRLLGGGGLLIGNSAHTGRENIAAIGTDRSGHLFVARYRQDHWTGFQPVMGQSPRILLSPPLFRPAITSHGS